MITTISCSIVALGIGLWLGYNLHIYLVKKAIEQMAREIYQEANNHPENNIVHIVIEREGETWYIYNEHTQEFLAQGKTPEQVNAVLRERFPNTYFTAAYDNAYETGYLNNERL